MLDENDLDFGELSCLGEGLPSSRAEFKTTKYCVKIVSLFFSPIKSLN